MFSRLIAISNGGNTTRPELPSEIPTLNSSSIVAPPPTSMQSLPDDSKLRPPPKCQSSLIQDRRTYSRKRKCVSNNELEVEQVPQSSSLNSTDMISTSVIRNSREVEQVPQSSSLNSTDMISTSVIRNSRENSYLSQENVVKGKRSRKTKHK